MAVWIPPLFVALLALPFILHQNSWWEWQSPYWLLERQTAHVAAHGTPTFFLHLAAGSFTPQHVFYAGPLLSLLAYPSVVFGAWPVFVAATVAAMVGGYLGIWWTARSLGLSRHLAVLPALVFSTTPYVLANLYGRGAWAELVGANAAAIVLGGGTALICRRGDGERWRGPTAALVLGGAMLAGTHNLSLLMAGVLVPLMLVALLPMAPRDSGLRGVALRAVRAALAAAVGVGLTAAWLVPNLWIGPRTYISSPGLNQQLLQGEMVVLHADNLLWPWPRVPPSIHGSSWLYVQAPSLAMAWAGASVLAIACTRRRRPDRVLLTAAALVALTAGAVLLLVNAQWWTDLPRLVQAIQFPFRLVPYVAMIAAIAVAIGLVGLAPGRLRLVFISALVAILALQGIMAVSITLKSKASSNSAVLPLRHGDVRTGVEPLVIGGPGLLVPYQYRVVGDPSGPVSPDDVAPVQVKDPSTSDVGTVTGVNAVGDAHRISAVWSPFIRITGDARLAGRTADGLAVVQVTHTAPDGRWHATVRSRCTTCLGALTGRDPWQLLAGRLLSLLSALTILGVGIRWLRQRRRGRLRPAA